MANLRTNNLSGEQGQNAIRGSVYFRGNRVTGSGDTPTDFLSVADHDDLDMGTGDFTFECWLLAQSYKGLNDPSFMGVCSSQDWTSGGILIQVANTGVLRVTVPSGINALGSTNFYNVQGRDWTHIAVVKTSGTIKGYVNGVEEISASHDVAVDFAHGGTCVIGENGPNQYIGDYAFRGYISNLRLSKGVVRYTSTFTPPAYELTADSDTVLLCCQNSDDVTQEETGKVISAHGGSYQTGSKNILRNGDFSKGTDQYVGDSGASISESGGVMTVTNGGGDNLYALRQNGVCRIGSKYRCTATVTATFTSGNPVFRVRFGGNNESFVEPQSSISNGVAFRLDTGEKVADGTNFEIGSGNSSGITQFTVTDLVVTTITPYIQPKVIPPYGVDAGNTFGGSIQQSSQGYMYFPTGRTEERGRGRAIISGAYSASQSAALNAIDFLSIQSMGNAQEFGDLTQARWIPASFSSSTRLVTCGGATPTYQNTIDYVTIASTGNATTFTGILSGARTYFDGHSNQTRGLTGGGRTPSSPNNTDTIDLLIIASKATATDFGNLSEAKNNVVSSGSPTRGLFMGGETPSRILTVESVELATTGNAADFGDMTSVTSYGGAVSSNTRVVYAGGYAPSITNKMEFFTTASAGNGTDFGDLITARIILTGSSSNGIRGVIPGGYTGSDSNVIEFITIASTGNAKDFGDLNEPKRGLSGSSDSHGGLT